MSNKEKEAIFYFNEGLNCAQSVVKSFAKEFDLNEAQALQMTSGFGAGMGRLQKTCGAVTGAFMVIGLSNSLAIQLNEQRNDETVRMIQEFEKEFRSHNKTTSCDELLQCDLKTAEGQKIFQQNNLHDKVCQKCISSAINILENILTPIK